MSDFIKRSLAENLPSEYIISKLAEDLYNICWLKEVGISDHTIIQLYQDNSVDIIMALHDNRDSCKEIITYLSSIGVEDQMIEEMLFYHTWLFLKSTNRFKSIFKSAALRKFVEDMSEDWDYYLCHVFEDMKDDHLNSL